MSSKVTASRRLGPDTPVRVLHCTAHLGVGGISQILLQTIPEFAPDRVATKVCYLNPRVDEPRAWISRGIPTHCLDHARRIHGVRTLLRLTRLIKTEGIRIIHSHRPLDRYYGALAARLCGIHHVSTLHNTTPPKRLSTLSPANLGAMGAFGELVFRHGTTRYVAVSQAVRRAQSQARGLPREKITVVYHGLDAKGFRRVGAEEVVTLRHQLGLAATDPVLLNVGRLHHQKGQAHLIPMMADVVRSEPDAVLLIAGEGEERPSLEAGIREAGLEERVRLLGRRTDIPRFLALADIFVFPSVRMEGLPIAVVEACAAGLPVVASRTGPLEEVVYDGKNGLLVPPGEPGSMARAVLQVLNDRERMHEYGSAGRKMALRRFSVQSTIDALTELYLELGTKSLERDRVLMTPIKA